MFLRLSRSFAQLPRWFHMLLSLLLRPLRSSGAALLRCCPPTGVCCSQWHSVVAVTPQQQTCSQITALTSLQLVLGQQHKGSGMGRVSVSATGDSARATRTSAAVGAAGAAGVCSSTDSTGASMAPVGALATAQGVGPTSSARQSNRVSNSSGRRCQREQC